MFVTPSDYKSYTNYIKMTVRYLSDVGREKLKSRILPRGSVMVTCIGSDMGKVALNPEEVITNQQVNSIIPNSNVNNIFLYYKLKDEYDTLRMYGGEGTAVPIVNKSTFENIELLFPPLPEQERIAEVLSSLDDKIDLLHRNNKTLEQLAETLFRQWFEKVENEESTTIKNIEEVATVQNGYSFKSSEFITEQTDTIEVLKMGHISAEGGLRTSPKKDFVKRDEKYNKWILNKRDIILAMTDMKDNVVILGVPALIDQDNKYVLNQRVGRIFVNNESLVENILILYMQMKDKNFISELQSKGNSGVQVNLGTDTIRQTKMVVPSKDNQRKILPQLESIFDKLDHNRNQVQQLETLRDTLLPKLMSGVVRVEK
jgi:type I restriction enzyme S subunit